MKTNIDTTTPPVSTLKEAVLAQIENLIPDGSFTVRDVINAVRAAANAGTIKLPGLEARPNDNGITYWVDHKDVARVVETLKNEGTLKNLGMTDTNFDGDGWVFHFDIPDWLSDETTPDEAIPAPAAIVTPNADPTQSPVEAKIVAYLNKVGSATLRQIQSALKINGITCKNLATMVADLGFTVYPGANVGCFSTYTAE